MGLFTRMDSIVGGQLAFDGECGTALGTTVLGPEKGKFIRDFPW